MDNKLESKVVDAVTARKLKDAGFPQDTIFSHYIGLERSQEITTIARTNDRTASRSQEVLPAPTLEELIEACGEKLLGLNKHYYEHNKYRWTADSKTYPCDCGSKGCNGYNWEYVEGKTPLEAVACLFLALNKK